MTFENSPNRRNNGPFAPMGPKPVEEGQVYDITIESVGAKGDGIGKINGFVVIVPKGQQGQTVKVKITTVRPKFAFGEIVGESVATETPNTDGSSSTSDEEIDDSDDEESDEDEDPADDSDDEEVDEETSDEESAGEE